MATVHTLDSLDFMDHTKYYCPGAGADLTPVFSPIIIVPINGSASSRRTRPARIHEIDATLTIVCKGSTYNAARVNARALLNTIIDINTDDVGMHTYVEQFEEEALSRTYTPLSASYKETQRELAGVNIIVVETQFKFDGTWVEA